MKLSLWLILVVLCVQNTFAINAEKGLRLIEKEKYEKAEEALKEALSENPKSVIASYGMALLHSNKQFKNRNLEHAFNYVHQAHELASTPNGRLELKKSDVNAQIIHGLLIKIENTLIHYSQLYQGEDGHLLYLKEHPNAENFNEVKKELIEIAWKITADSNSLNRYNHFIQAYPGSDHIEEAKKLRNAIAFHQVKEQNSVDALDHFIKQYPDAEQISLATQIRNQQAYIELLEEKEKLLQAEKKEQQAQQDKELAIESKKKLILEAEKERETATKKLLFLIAGILLILVIASLMLYLIKRKDNIKIKAHRDEITLQKDKLEIQRNQILDSISYARFIQNAILPPVEKIKEKFEDAFVLFKPKDIVSGDFYWFAEHQGKRIIAAVDCTGHGVPGAFMSMIGNTLLNHIVKFKNITGPNEILQELRLEVINALNQNGEEQHDGMDIALAVISSDKIEFAGAYNPLIHIREELTEIKADRMPIGRHFSKQSKSFTKHAIELKKGDQIYLFSDGFADQFGGQDNKKFGSKRLKQLLIDIHDKPASQQSLLLEDAITTWMGEEEQLDDILVIGVKV